MLQRNNSVLSLKGLVGKLVAGDREERFVRCDCLFVLVQRIVRRCFKKQGSR